MKTLITAALATLLLIPVMPAAAETPSVDEIVRRTNEASYYQGNDGRARVRMTITDAQGRTREREFTILRLNTDDRNENQKFYVYFHRPADVRETVFLVWKNAGADDDRWLYLPALDVTRRIAASDVRTSFVGSDFFYEDVSGRGIEEDHHELIEVTDTYFVLKNTPKNPGAVEFDSFTMWIDKNSFLPVRVRYEKDGEIYRQLDTLNVEEIEGFLTVTQARMRDLANGTETVLDYSDVQYNIGLTEDIFTERYLRRPPREFIR